MNHFNFNLFVNEYILCKFSWCITQFRNMSSCELCPNMQIRFMNIQKMRKCPSHLSVFLPGRSQIKPGENLIRHHVLDHFPLFFSKTQNSPLLAMTSQPWRAAQRRENGRRPALSKLPLRGIWISSRLLFFHFWIFFWTANPLVGDGSSNGANSLPLVLPTWGHWSKGTTAPSV